MKTSTSSSSRQGFTLIELLVVIAIIAILASLLLPVVARVKVSQQITSTKVQMALLASAIESYEATYGHPPVGPSALRTIQSGDDYTYGGSLLSLAMGPGNWIADNNEVMAILLDLERFRDGTPTINVGHVKNPQRSVNLSPEFGSTVEAPGVGPDGVYRDAWGTPFIITIDTNDDGICRDAFYRLQAVSRQIGPTGFNGLSNPIDSVGAGDHFQRTARIMIWSAGPDRMVDRNQPANQKPNRDNLLIWK